MKKIKEKQLLLIRRMALVGCVLTVIQFFFFLFFIKVSLINYFNAFLLFVFGFLFFLSEKKYVEVAKALYFSVSIPFILFLSVIFPHGGMEIYFIPAILLLYLLYDVKTDKKQLIVFFSFLLTSLSVSFILRFKYPEWEIQIPILEMHFFYFLNVLFSLFLTAFAGYTFAYSSINSEEKFQDTEAKLLAMFESSVESIFLLDAAMNIQWFNKRSANDVKRALGKDLVIGKSALDYIVPSARQQYLDNFQKALMGTPVEYDRQLVTPAGETIYYQINFVPVYNVEQKLIGVATKGLDVTRQYKERDRELSLMKLRKQIAQNQLKQKNLGLIIHGQEMERQRISEELHSGLAQTNALIRMHLFGYEKLSDDQKNERIHFLQEMLDQIDNEIQRISNALMPGAIKDLGLIEALEGLLSDVHVHCSVVFDEEVRKFQWTGKQKISIFRIFEEIASIVTKTESIKSSEIIFAKKDEESFLLEITFVTSNEEDLSIPIKLNNMTLRAELIHAKFDLHQKKHISIITITIPSNNTKLFF